MENEPFIDVLAIKMVIFQFAMLVYQKVFLINLDCVSIQRGKKVNSAIRHPFTSTGHPMFSDVFPHVVFHLYWPIAASLQLESLVCFPVFTGQKGTFTDQIQFGPVVTINLAKLTASHSPTVFMQSPLQKHEQLSITQPPHAHQPARYS
jgi:hypothetical protein